MRDPLPSAPQYLVRSLEPICQHLHLPLLPYHIHELITALFFYQITYIYLGPALSTYFFPKKYTCFDTRQRLDWNIHVVSFTQATFISFLAQYVVLFDEERKQMDWQQRAWGWTGLSAMTLAIANGYFVWHLIMMILHVRTYGWAMVAHAIATFFLMIQGFRPAFLTYGVASYLYEWSNIPLNIYRALLKLQMEKSRFHVINGVALTIIFFLCRIIWGTYLTAWFYIDIWSAWTAVQIPKDAQRLPGWLLAGHAASATVLQLLNYIWFWKIAGILVKRLLGGQKKRADVKAE